MSTGRNGVITPIVVNEAHSKRSVGKASHGVKIPVYDIGDRRSVANESIDNSPTLTARMGTGGNNVPVFIEPQSYCLQGSMIGRADKNGPQGDGINEDVVAFACNQRDEVRDMKDKSGALQAQPGMKQQTFIVTKVYGIGAFNSEGMKSDNPHSGIYEAETSRTIDLNGGSPACNQGGMAIVQCVEPGALSRGQGERVWDKCPTLRANMGDNQPCVVLNDQCGSQMDISNDVVGTLRAEMHGNIPAVTTYSFQRSDEFKETDKASTQSRRQYKDATDLVCSVDCRNFNETDKHGTLQAKGNGGQSLNYMGAVREGYSVRRLTPLECERLQGFPDGWTDIPGQTEATQEELEFWREVWLTWDKTQAEDPEKVKPRTDNRLLRWLKNPVSDSAQYKALGNSVAVPCPEYVLEGISEVFSTER
jgi:DNA (cytosine-5)-methyltransferase 1